MEKCHRCNFSQVGKKCCPCGLGCPKSLPQSQSEKGGQHCLPLGHSNPFSLGLFPACFAACLFFLTQLLGTLLALGEGNTQGCLQEGRVALPQLQCGAPNGIWGVTLRSAWLLATQGYPEAAKHARCGVIGGAASQSAGGG